MLSAAYSMIVRLPWWTVPAFFGAVGFVAVVITLIVLRVGRK
jgi:hypothetical protein